MRLWDIFTYMFREIFVWLWLNSKLCISKYLGECVPEDSLNFRNVSDEFQGRFMPWSLERSSAVAN